MDSLVTLVAAVDASLQPRTTEGYLMWTSKELAFVKEHLGEMSATEIGRHLGKSRNAVHGAISRLRNRMLARGEDLGKLEKRRRPLRQSHPDCLDTIRTLHDRGWSDEDVAHKLGVSRQCVREYRVSLGLGSNHGSARHRKKLAAAACELYTLSVANALKAEALGWEGHNYTEARVLDLLHREGPMTGKAIADRLGLNWRKGSSFTGITLRRLLRDGRLTRTNKREGLYGLADGLEPSGMSPDIEEHFSGDED
jgi:biotin operon repressor